MRHLPAIAAGLLLAVPTVAQPVPQEQLTGVWTGTVAGQPVHACFDWRDWRGDGELSGVYYYDRVLSPIRLAEQGADLAEWVDWQEPSGARWRLDRLSGEALSATFIDGTRQAPIRLVRAAWDPREYYPEACASAAFLDPRFAGGYWVEEAGWLDGHALFTTNWVPPPNLAGEGGRFPDVELAGLRLVESLPGDGAINRHLAALTSLDDARECIAATGGLRSNWSASILPEVLTRRWLGVLSSYSDYCGGVHPNHYQYRAVYDRLSGENVAPGDWFAAEGMTIEWEESGNPDEPRRRSDSLTPALLDLVMAHWPATGRDEEGDGECRAIARDAWRWDVGLQPGGLGFLPQLPHVAQACAETVLVPWPELAPYLNDQGRAVMADLTAP